MKKIILSILVVLIILGAIAGGCYYLFSAKKDVTVETEAEVQEEVETEKTEEVVETETEAEVQEEVKTEEGLEE